MDRKDKPEHQDALVPEVVPNAGAFAAWRQRERELAEATTPEKVIDYKAKMASIGRYFATAKRNFAAAQEAAFCWLRACRKLGAMVTAMQLKPGRPKKVTQGNHKPKTLEDYGITKRDAHKWRRLSEIPEPVFMEWRRKMVEAGKVLTETALLAYADTLVTEDVEPEKPWTLDTELGRVRRLLWAMLERCPGQDARDDIVAHLRAWATEIEEETNATRTEKENKA